MENEVGAYLEGVNHCTNYRWSFKPWHDFWQPDINWIKRVQQDQEQRIR
ncbi:hypothetical protein O9992_28825 [Vibrio lentus]|nr:hypothetical protein [Vibrio lentus]